MRLMLDTSVLFALDNEEPELLADMLAVADRLEPLITPVQADEDKRGSRAMRELPLQRVETSHAVAGDWHLGEARFGDTTTFEPLRSGNLKHTRDALITASAAFHGAVLVMRDNPAVRRLRGATEPVPELQELEVWGLDELGTHVASLTGG